MSTNIERDISYTVTFPNSTKFSMYLANAELEQVAGKHDILTLNFKGSLRRGTKNYVNKKDPVKFTWKVGKLSRTFIGYVQIIEKNNTAGNTFTKIVCINNSSKLKRTSKKVYINQTADRIVKTIAKNTIGFKAFAHKHPYKYARFAQSGQSNWQILRQLAKQTGYALRAENTTIIFKPQSLIISEKVKKAPVFIHYERAPKGAVSFQSLMSFTGIDSQESPEIGHGDVGISVHGPLGQRFAFSAGYNLNSEDSEGADVILPQDLPSAPDTTIDGIPYVPPTPAATPSPSNKTFYVTSYGAKTSKSDNTDEFKAAVEAARLYVAAHPSERAIVFIPKGTWNISTKHNSIRLSSNLTVQCEPGAIIKNHSTNYFLTTDTTHYTMTAYNGPKDIIIDGGVWDGVLKSKGFTFVHHDGITIRNLTIKDHYGDGHGIEINSSRDVLIQNCKLLGVRNAGGGKAPRDMDEAIQLDFAWKGSAGGSGNDGTPCLNVTIEGCYFGGSGTHGSTHWPRAIGGHKNGHDSSRHSNITIQNNTIVGCNGTGGGAIRFFNMRNVTIDSNHISKCYLAINGLIKEKDWPDGTYGPSKLDNIQIINNVIDNCGTWKTHDATPSGLPAPGIWLNVSGASTAYFEDVVISGNRITNHHGSEPAIEVQNTHTVTINHNYVPDRHCGTNKSNMIITGSSSGVTVTKNTPDNT